MEPKRGPGHVQWNIGGWIGGQVGSTCWVLLVAVVLLSQAHFVVGMVGLAWFLVPNLAGIIMWRRRARIGPYPALQLLIVIIGVCALGMFLTLDIAGEFENPLLESVTSDGLSYRWLWIFPGMMAWFHWMERSARRASSGPPKR